MPDAYLGRTADGKPLRYSINDLLTHGVCVGMTGSGKTGLCVGLLEELLLSDTPLFLLDPKGDVTNLLLMFPELRSEDFAAWVDPETARRAGHSAVEEGAAVSKLWREGLRKWKVPLDSLGRLRAQVCYRVFTPGSRTGRPVDVLGTLALPEGLSFERDEEAVRDELRGAVSGLLGLAGIEADPLSDPRHILVSRVLESQWRAGKPVDLAGIVALTENPPFDRVGAMDLEAVLPRAKRRELALALNNVLSSPGFDAWRSGQPLEPGRLLRDASGRPACNLFYLAHLDDKERMFFVTRFLERFWAWVRTQSGSTDLKTLLYFDEIFGYLPPVAEPPSKRPLLSLLKQARAFGVGVLAVTQNPVDLDYKALSNTGTWMVGRLQAERDKERLLDGLEGAGIGMSRAEADRTVSGLEKRRFLLHDVHRPGGPVVFETRWARAYLRGPLSLRQIPELTRQFAETAAASGLAPLAAPASEPTASASAGGGGAGFPPALDAVFQPRYQPDAPPGTALAGEVAVLVEARISRQRPAVAGLESRLVRFGAGPVPVAVTDGVTKPDEWPSTPPAGSAYGPLPPWATKVNAAAALERSAKDLVASEGFTLEAVSSLGLVRQPGEGDAEFSTRVKAAVDEESVERLSKLRGPRERRIATLERQIAEQSRELERDRSEKTRAATYSAIDVGASVLGTLLGGGRRSIGSAGRAGGRAFGRIQRAAESVKESEEKIAAWTREREALASEIEAEAAAERSRLENESSRRETARIPIERSDVRILGWYVLWRAKS
ncbi:MAG TPA: ATP-binding protein [Thermoanaerobaculia bacterium]|nr:ATP-binding protein [Thermoanaerobaculia bacterium]